MGVVGTQTAALGAGTDVGAGRETVFAVTFAAGFATLAGSVTDVAAAT